jgi:HJR/Mrr/RecB family endonuclease
LPERLPRQGKHIQAGDRNTLLNQADSYSKPLGDKAVQQAIAALSYYQDNKAVVITNNFLTRSAVELAKSANIELIPKQACFGIRHN